MKKGDNKTDKECKSREGAGRTGRRLIDGNKFIGMNRERERERE